MSITAMKQAMYLIDAWERGADSDDYASEIAALRQAIEQAEKQEPVAYLNIEIEGTGGYLDWDNDIPASWYKSIPLYTAPPKPDAWLSGEGLELKQVLVKQNGNWVETPFSVGQPRTEWVSLSDTEINKIVDLNTSDDGGFDIWCDGIAVARIVCAKLKELNK